MVKVTQIFIALSAVIWLVYDAWVIISHGKESSISQVIIDYSYNYPIGVLLVGIVLGHLFWRMPNKKGKKDE